MSSTASSSRARSARTTTPRSSAGWSRSTATAIPSAWPLFDRLAGIPILVLRGALSDLFSAATLDEMRRRRPDLHVLVVENRGHCPTLDEPECRQAIRSSSPRSEPSPGVARRLDYRVATARTSTGTPRLRRNESATVSGRDQPWPSPA